MAKHGSRNLDDLRLAEESIQVGSSVDVDSFLAPRMCIVLLGKIGSGKAGLINSLFGTSVAKEGSSLISQSEHVERYTKMVNFTTSDVRVTLWDTSSLMDPYDEDKQRLTDIRDECRIGDADLFVYCIRFTQPRFGHDDLKSIQNITDAYGGGIWKRVLFALTFANEAALPSHVTDKSLSEYYQFHLEEWKKVLHRTVEVGGQVINTIPVIPTGYRDLPLPDNGNWKQEFWSACFTRMNLLALPAMADYQIKQMDKEPVIDEAQVAKRLASPANHGATSPPSSSTVTTSSVNSVTNGDSPGGAIAATPNDSSTSGKSGNAESTEESNGAQGGESGSSKKLPRGSLNLDENEESKIDLLHDGIQKYLQENDCLDDEHELCRESNKQFFKKCDLSAYDCKKYKSYSTNAPGRSPIGKASNQQAGDKTTMVTTSIKTTRETSKQVTSTTGVGFKKFGFTGEQQVAASYGTKRGSEEGEAVDTRVDYHLDESTDVQIADETWSMETEIKDLTIKLPKKVSLYYHKIGEEHGPLNFHVGREKVDLKGIEEIQISGTYRWEYQRVAPIF